MHFSTLALKSTVLLSLQAVAHANTLPMLESRKPQPGSAFLRVESEDKTIYDGRVADPHGRTITLPSGGTHHCDGTNDGANPTPGPTCTSILYAASRHGGGKSSPAYPSFALDGSYDSQFDDYFITKIGDSDSNTANDMFWGVLLEYAFTASGGCESQITPNSHTLWAFDAFNKEYFLKLTGPMAGKVNKAFKVNVQGTDGEGGSFSPVAGSQVFPYEPTTGMAVAGSTGIDTDPSTGDAMISVSAPGTYHFKAYENNSIRSGAITVVVS